MNEIDRSDINLLIKRAHDSLKAINPHLNRGKHFAGAIPSSGRKGKLQKVLIANRGEIAKRFFLALHEEGIPSVAVVTDPDKGQSWYDFADEVVFIGEHTHYSNPHIIVAATQIINANAVYSGYGFLSENPEFVKIIDTLNRTSAQQLIFMGPGFDAMDIMGHKGNARRIAKENGIPLFDSSDIFSVKDMAAITAEAGRISYPVILKPVSGGGGKGMVTVYAEGELEPAVDSCIRTSLSLYNDPSFYIEKLIKNPVHIEVQIFNGWAIGIRKCAVQRRNQKIIEESGEIFIDETVSAHIISAAEKLAEISGYSRNCGAGTVEFLIDQDTGETGFLEMNTRLQVEYAVTDQSLDIDLVKCQVQLYDGRDDELQHLGNLDHRVTYRNHAIECRIYAEDPENGYLPSPGVIAELNLPTFNGVRCDFGFRDGDSVLPMYDPMIGKLIVHGRTRSETLIRLERALQELYIRGVKTNVPQLLRIIRHPEFIKGSYNNNFLSDNSDFNRGVSDSESLHGESSLHIIMGGFAEYLRLFNEKVSGFISVSAIEGIADTPVPEADTDFTVSYSAAVFYVRFLQVSINRYYSFINEEYAGTITLNFTNNTADNIIVNYKERVLRLRVDRKPGEVILRIRNDRNKISYYSMSVSADRTVTKNRTEIIRSPFQGTVVSLCKNLTTGDMIWEGDPVIILSSMKMETTICSPVDGVISYIIGAKDHGAIEGIGIHEGEVLVKIETGHDTDSSVSSSTGFFNSYFREKLLPSVISNPGEYIQLISSIYSSLIMGYISGSYYAEIIQKIISDAGFSKWKSLIDDQISDMVISGLMHAACINRIFSRSAAVEGIAFYDEFNTLIQQRNADEPELSENFTSLMAELLNSYGLTEYKEINLFTGSNHFEPVIMFMCMSHRFISENPDLIKNLLYILPHLPASGSRILQVADLYIDEKQSRELAITAQKSAETKEERKGITPVLSDGCFKKSSRLKELHFRNIEFLENHYDIECIDSSAPCFPVYRITVPGREDNYIAFALIDGNTPDIQYLYEKIEAAASYALSLMADYREEEKAGHWLHIIIADAPASISDNRYNFISSLRDSLTASIGMMKLFSSFNGIIDCSVMPGNSDSGPARKLRFYIELDRVVFEYLSESDSRSPYYLSEKNSKADQKLFNINKWPVELWADECFDSGIHEEIRIASIDYNISDDNKTRDAGAKIFTGRMHGSEACFFMKDSRINSGSTGNAEGLKYVAASYLSIMKGIPLYVWNDGAGANIKEGVIALNRGAEGFMMNALQTGFTPGKFRSFIMHNPDPVLIALFESINMQFGFSTDSLPDTPRPLSLVAVGTGSSAGLDVYGSSQAVIQVMLDSEQSYRVLTGSGVIKSIIGEDISNYEIGGAKRICRDTGIADILSPDKFHLIETIREIHGFFYSGIEANFTAVRNDDRRTGETVNNPAIVLNDSIIRRNADHGKFLELKKYYRGADSLIGGFIKLCGQPVMIIGAKSRNGITGEASVIKAHELLKSAQRTCSHEIIVFGRELVRDGKDERLSSRIDFMNTLQSPKRLRIHIITDPDGLKLYYINNTADIIIFVDHNRISGDNDNFIKNNSAFRCSSINEAFTLSRGIIALISGQRENIENHGVPSIPGNPSTPFDMVTSVIEPVFDNETFIEFYSGMNNPDTGPMLITGIASLQGTAVGIIADHPLRKGGAADASGTEKFRIFTEFLNRQKIPLIMLSNSSGFMPGSQQENLRIQAIGAESLDANILGEIPVVSVTLHQNYGGRLIQAFNKFLRPGIVYLAFADSILAVIGTKVAFDILKGKEYARLIEEGKLEEAEKLKAEFYEEYLAKSRGASGGIESRLVDWIIPDIKDLREHLIKGFELAKERCREAFGE